MWKVSLRAGPSFKPMYFIIMSLRSNRRAFPSISCTDRKGAFKRHGCTQQATQLKHKRETSSVVYRQRTSLDISHTGPRCLWVKHHALNNLLRLNICSGQIRLGHLKMCKFTHLKRSAIFIMGTHHAQVNQVTLWRCCRCLYAPNQIKHVPCTLLTSGGCNTFL